jgi:hypothetical protein
MQKTSGIISDIQARLAGLACPFCGRGKLDLHLRCDVHADGCLFIAHCDSCRMQYTVDLDTAPSCDAQGQRQERITTVSCPCCGRQDCAVAFQCTVPSRRCGYKVQCRVCQSSQGVT